MDVSALLRWLKILLTDRKYYWFLAALVLAGDGLLTQLIIRFVPCRLLPVVAPAFLTKPTDTEIDWETYMYQVELYIKGERDYAAIEGPTGPLVYVFDQNSLQCMDV